MVFGCGLLGSTCGPGSAFPWPLFGRRTNSLKNFFANLRIVLCHHQDRVVLLYREALVSNRLHEGVIGLTDNALPVRWGRCFELLLIILLDGGHLSQGSRRGIKLLVWNVRRRIRETRRWSASIIAFFVSFARCAACWKGRRSVRTAIRLADTAFGPTAGGGLQFRQFWHPWHVDATCWRIG